MSPVLFTSCSANYPLELPHLSCFHLCSVLTCLSLCNQSCVSTYNPPFTFIKTSVFPPMFYWFLVSGYALFSPVTAVDIVFFSDFCQLRRFFFIGIPPNSTFCTHFFSSPQSRTIKVLTVDVANQKV